MKTLLITIQLVLLTTLVSAQGNLRFSYNVANNGANTVVDVFVQNIVPGTENMTSFTMNAYYDNTESSLTSFDVSPTNSLGWLSLPSSSAFNPASNNNIPVTHTGFGNVNVLDFFSSGTDFGQTPVKILTINFDNSPGTAAGSAVFLTSFSDGHDAQVYNDNVAPIPNAYPVIMSQTGGFPVEWLSFEAKALGTSQSLLEWSTASEMNNAGYYVERSVEVGSVREWEILGFVDGKGTTTEVSSYEFVDNSPFIGENLYRIRQVDLNGQHDYSEIRNVYFEPSLSMSLYPNPADRQTSLQIDMAEGGNVKIEVLDGRGRIVRIIENLLEPGRNRVDIPVEQLAEGIYTVRIANRSGASSLRLIVI